MKTSSQVQTKIQTKSFKLLHKSSLASILKEVFELKDRSLNYAVWSSSKKNSSGCWTDSKFSYAVVSPQKVLRIKNDKVEIFLKEEKSSFLNPSYKKTEEGLDSCPLDVLKEESKEYFKSSNDFIKNGLLGVLAYDLSRYFEPTVEIQPKTEDPDLLVFFPGTQFYLNEESNEVAVKSDLETLKLIESKLTNSQILHSSDFIASGDQGYSKRFSSSEFQNIVKKVKKYIKEGDVFQAVVANSFDFIDKSLFKNYCPLQQFSNLSILNPSPYLFTFKFNDWSLTGASPEMFLQSEPKRKISMRLVAGTYPKSVNEVDDEKVKKSLLSDPKEKAEHMMLVDHARNDIGKVSKTGTVRPEKIMMIETYSDLHHILSVVSGTLKKGEDLFSAIKSCFPISTLTGTPKIRAMQIIEELEGSRGAYGGSVFCLEENEIMDSAVIIRSIIKDTQKIKVPAGCGVVWDSNPQNEDNECLTKAKALIRSLQCIFKLPFDKK